MIVTKKHLPRRTFLRGLVGTSIALPLLDSMIPALTAATKTAASPRTRLGFVYVPHGAVMDQWTPATEGAGFEFTPILKPLEPFRQQLLDRHRTRQQSRGIPRRRRRRSCPQRALLPERYSPAAHRGRGCSRRHHHRSNRGEKNQPGYAAAFTRARHRRHRLSRGLRRRL